jgi:hypothetical protein
VLALASKIRYRIDPADEYPRNFSGHLRAVLMDGTVREIRRPHMRGGVHAPLPEAELEAKFMDNVLYGGWQREQGERVRVMTRTVFSQPDLSTVTELRR